MFKFSSNRFLVMFIFTCILAANLIYVFSAEENSPQGIIERAVISVKEGKRENAIAHLNTFKKSVKEFDLSKESNLMTLNTAAQLFYAADDIDGTKKLHELSLTSISKIKEQSNRDSTINHVASIFARNGGSCEMLIELSKLSTQSDCKARTLFLAVMAESRIAPKMTLDDFLPQSRNKKNVQNSPDQKASTKAMKKILAYIMTLNDTDTQLNILLLLSDQFSRKPFDALFDNEIKEANIDADMKSYIIAIRNNKQKVIEQNHADTEQINNKIIEAANVVGGFDHLNPRKIDRASENYKKAKVLLDTATTQAKKLRINEGRSTILYAIADAQVNLGDLESAKKTLTVAIDAEKKINKNDVLLEQMANLQLTAGDYEGAANTTKIFVTPTKNQPTDRILYTASKKLINSGQFDKAKEYAKQISDTEKRKELESSIENKKNEPKKDNEDKKQKSEVNQNGFREWKSKDTFFKATAKFVAYNPTTKTVTFIKKDNEKITMELDDLCNEDKKYIHELLNPKLPKEN
jgi:hypothetical protein